MTQIRLCPACWQRVEPLLGKAALDEREYLKMIARRIRTCRLQSCKLQADVLKLVAQKSPLDRVVEWFSLGSQK